MLHVVNPACVTRTKIQKLYPSSWIYGYLIHLFLWQQIRSPSGFSTCTTMQIVLSIISYNIKRLIKLMHSVLQTVEALSDYDI